MAGESSLLSRVSVRFATLADYKAVLAIHGNVFDGFDYLQMTYFDFLRDKNAYNFVAELDGEVVRMFTIFTYTIISITCRHLLISSKLLKLVSNFTKCHQPSAVQFSGGYRF